MLATPVVSFTQIVRSRSLQKDFLSFDPAILAPTTNWRRAGSWVKAFHEWLDGSILTMLSFLPPCFWFFYECSILYLPNRDLCKHSPFLLTAFFLTSILFVPNYLFLCHCIPFRILSLGYLLRSFYFLPSLCSKLRMTYLYKSEGIFPAHSSF